MQEDELSNLRSVPCDMELTSLDDELEGWAELDDVENQIMTVVSDSQRRPHRHRFRGAVSGGRFSVSEFGA